MDDSALAALGAGRPRARRPGGERRIWPVVLLLLVLVAGIGWAAYLGSSLGGGDGGGTAAGTTTAPETTTTTGSGTTGTTTAAGGAVTGLTATSYDPTSGGGDGDEHPEETANALDGSPATTWRTDTYRGTAEFAGIKPGVGLILSSADPVTAQGRCACRPVSPAGRAASTRLRAPRRPLHRRLDAGERAVQRAHRADGHPADAAARAGST